MTAIRIAGLHYDYPDGAHALRGVDLAVEDGECMGIVGPNGAGKSTLLLHLNGLLHGQGDVEVAGINTADGDLTALRRKVGMVFQNADDQLFMPTVYDDVAFAAVNAQVEPLEVRARVQRALQLVGMEGVESRHPHHLSVGQKKRVALATVMVVDCEILVLDEPASGLDPRGRRDFIELLKSLDVTTVVATHDMNLAYELCDRVVILDAGIAVACGPADRILLDEPLLAAHGLEKPMLAALNEAVSTGTVDPGCRGREHLDDSHRG